MLRIWSERYYRKWFCVKDVQGDLGLFYRGILSNWIVPRNEFEKAEREVHDILDVLQTIVPMCRWNDGVDKSLSHAFRG